MHSIHYLANKAQWLIQCVIFRKGKFKLYDSQNSAQTPKMSRGENSNGNSANISNKEKDALQFVLVSSQSDKMQTGHYQKRRRATLLSCQLPPLRAEGSKKWQKTLLFNHKTTVQVHNCTKAILKCV